MKMKEQLFSYGTLQKKEVQIKLFGRILHGVADTLEGYEVCTIEIRDESFLSKGEGKYQQTLVISKDKNDQIKGTVFEITEEELLLADKYEPDNYTRIKVILESGKEAWIYVAVETSK
jgi:gamma-glutamylcyclotransferase (GGCT)/AIG2-like uncharacterized protein YtfP